MPMRFFTVPALDGGESERELNGFVGSHKVGAIKYELVHDGAASFWAICVTFLGGPTAGRAEGKKTRVDYREVLSEQDFALFARLRSLRKELSEQEGVPAYALFTNEQLASIVTRCVRTKAGLQEIEGVGPSRVEKYGDAFLSAITSGTKADG